MSEEIPDLDALPLAEQLKLLRRLQQLEKDFGLNLYEPHEKQQAFHKAAWAKYRYLRTGNRFGKSTCGTAEDLAFALGERPWLKKEDPARYLGIPKRSTRGLILVADWDKAREIYTEQSEGASQGKLFKFMPKNAFQGVHKSQAGEIDCVFVKSIWGGLSSIYIDTVRSFMGNPMGQESSNWDWIHVDEPIPRAMWDANSRGLMDTDGKAWFTCTPIEHQWINEFFIPRHRLKEEFNDGWSQEEASKWVMTGTTYDNTTLTRKAIDSYMDGLTEDARNARIYGRPLGMQGAVYSMFDPIKHVFDEPPHGWKDICTPPEDYTIRIAVDPHPKTPHAVLFAATAPSGQTFFYDEYFQHVRIDELVEVILDKLMGRVPQIVLVDRTAFNQDPISGATWADAFYRVGLPAVPASKELSHGIQMVSNALMKTGSEALYFSSRLSETLYEFDAYVWDQKKDNKPKDKDDHMMENLYRLVLNGLTYVPIEHQSAIKMKPMSFSGALEIPRMATEGWWNNQAA